MFVLKTEIQLHGSRVLKNNLTVLESQNYPIFNNFSIDHKAFSIEKILNTIHTKEEKKEKI